MQAELRLFAERPLSELLKEAGYSPDLHLEHLTSFCYLQPGYHGVTSADFVEIDVRLADGYFRNNAQMYLPNLETDAGCDYVRNTPHGEGGLQYSLRKYDGVRKFLFARRIPIGCSKPYLNEDSRRSDRQRYLTFTDGTHRFCFMRDQGFQSVVVQAGYPESAELLRRFTPGRLLRMDPISASFRHDYAEMLISGLSLLPRGTYLDGYVKVRDTYFDTSRGDFDKWELNLAYNRDVIWEKDGRFYSADEVLASVSGPRALAAAHGAAWTQFNQRY